jgi:hypothetical protein
LGVRLAQGGKSKGRCSFLSVWSAWLHSIPPTSRSSSIGLSPLTVTSAPHEPEFVVIRLPFVGVDQTASKHPGVNCSSRDCHGAVARSCYSSSLSCTVLSSLDKHVVIDLSRSSDKGSGYQRLQLECLTCYLTRPNSQGRSHGIKAPRLQWAPEDLSVRGTPVLCRHTRPARPGRTAKTSRVAAREIDHMVSLLQGMIHVRGA